MPPKNLQRLMDKKDMGRPSSFDPDVHIPLIHKLSRTGSMTRVNIAAELGITTTTLGRWAKEHEQIAEMLSAGDTCNESHLTDILMKIGTGQIRGNSTAILAILNRQHGWKGAEGGSGNTYNIQNNIQNNVSLTYNQINDELQKYLEKMGVKNLKEVQENIIDAEFTEV